MERLQDRLNLAAKSLATLREVASMEVDPVPKRDITIIRFIYTFEALWKAARQFLMVVEGIDVQTPKGCVRGCRDAGLLTDEQTVDALTMADDRNLTIHIYNEALAQEIYARVPRHISVMEAWFGAMSERVEDVGL